MLYNRNGIRVFDWPDNGLVLHPPFSQYEDPAWLRVHSDFWGRRTRRLSLDEQLRAEVAARWMEEQHERLEAEKAALEDRRLRQLEEKFSSKPRNKGRREPKVRTNSSGWVRVNLEDLNSVL